MRERLIELLDEARNEHLFEDKYNEAVADYLLANGVIIPPCEVGDKIYVILYSPLSKKYFVHETQANFLHSINGHWYVEYQDGSKSKLLEFGIKAFTDKEEAVAALKGCTTKR